MIKKWLARMDISLRARRMLKRSKQGRGEIELSLLAALTRQGSTNIDVGANKGVYTYQLRKRGTLVAFEPIPHLSEQLRTAAYSNVTIRQCALGTKAGRATLSIPRHRKRKGALDTPSASLRTHGAGDFLEIDVDVRTIDSFGFTDVGFIKIDVEGWEENVLAGGRDTIARCQPIVMTELFEAYAPGALEKVPAFFASLDYEGLFVDQRSRTVKPIDQLDRDHPQTQNFIFVPRAGKESFSDTCRAMLA